MATAKKPVNKSKAQTMEKTDMDTVQEIVTPQFQTDEVQQENEMLKKQMEEMKARMVEMEQMFAQATRIKPEVSSDTYKKDRNITFINMYPGTTVLKGSSVYKIEGQFASRTFLEREARMIVNNTANLVRSGMVYIPDHKFVEENDLEYAYQNILTDEQLKNLLNQNAVDIIETFKNVSDGQKTIILEMIAAKKLSNQFVDANVLMELGKISGRDLIGIEPEEENN